jgi:predicted O-methyltransferase YrrM
VAAAFDFVVARSLDYFAACRERFDLVFLDGDHGARTVYREIAAALAVLAPGGAILLHDLFPAGAAYGPDGSEIPGPRLALERLRAEGAPLLAVPLAPLPWPTLRPDGATSLALLLRES